MCVCRGEQKEEDSEVFLVVSNVGAALIPPAETGRAVSVRRLQPAKRDAHAPALFNWISQGSATAERRGRGGCWESGRCGSEALLITDRKLITTRRVCRKMN